MTYSLSRRQLFKRSVAALAVGALPQSVWATDNPPLFIPKLLETHRGKPIFLNLQTAQTSFLNKKPTEVWGFNGQYLGPTIRVKRGDFVKLNYSNNLSQFVALNIQGLQTSGELLGGIAKTLQKNGSWSPVIPINQSAATCWYHACTLANSAYQTYRGLVGMWIIEDSDSQKTKLPNKYGVNDIPLILQDIQLNRDGVPLFQQGDRFEGDYLLVNGQQAPYLNVQRGIVRLRLLNASLSRDYELRLDNGKDFTLIARSLGFLPQGKTINRLHLAPGERAEILLDLNDGENVSLITGFKRGLLDQMGQFFKANTELRDNTVLKLCVEGLPSVFTQKQEWSFNTDAVEILKQKVQRERQFALDRTNATINQQRFDSRRIDISTNIGAIERWTLTTTGDAMGFTLQGAKFIVESVNGKVSEETEVSWQDTVWVDGTVEILVKFEHPSSNNYPFTFGSSDLVLADKGCIGTIIVQ